MKNMIDLDRYPLDQPGTATWSALVAECRTGLAGEGLFNLTGFLREDVLARAVDELRPILSSAAFCHTRRHNIYFRKSIEGLDVSHPALQEFETSNRVICADQMGQAVIIQLYEWKPFATFLAAVMGKAELHTMADPLARVNVMSYAEGQALNWHFDRSEFTTTLLLQAPAEGGEFEFDKDLRSDADPNYSGVADLLGGRRTSMRTQLEPGTLNVFRGKNTAHRVTAVKGNRDRIIAVFSYFERPGVTFSEEERVGFYGRAS
ncbi:MAG: 2OG-Fe(II) oxygenase [Rhodobacteraceae bacterium]|nr:2OG-Fe(II) oxygenase [Paracoccaceae bacterium]MCY4140761.1 2OG-Fe(II) oxygenase [Paracoccaceae bacterium]